MNKIQWNFIRLNKMSNLSDFFEYFTKNRFESHD